MPKVSLEEKLTRYMVVAGAALSVASSAKAGLVKTVFDTPQDLTAQGFRSFDLNGDTHADFGFSYLGNGVVYFLNLGLTSNLILENANGVIPLTDGYVLGTGDSSFGGAAQIGGTGTFFVGLEIVTSVPQSSTYYANYGYAQLNGLQWIGYAFEEFPNVSITVTDLTSTASEAPEPGTWETLALGATGLGVFGLRKRFRAA